MIFDSVKQLEAYKEFPYLYKALEYIKSLPEGTFPESGEVFEENIFFFNPVTLTTKPESECKYEAHKNFIDIHYTIAGSERIKISELSELDVLEAYDEKRDIGFYEGKENSCVDVTSGKFLVCFPHDAHKVAMMTDAPSDVKKLVFKVNYDAFLNSSH